MAEARPLSKLRTHWSAKCDQGATEDASVLTLWLSTGGNDVDASEVVIEFAYEDPLTGTTLAPGSRVALHHTGAFECTTCGKGVKKLFDGHCFPCLRNKACADNCVMSPHLCHFQAGTCREPAWGLEFCYQPHYVYLSFTDKFKVGITRAPQVPTRWIDQGATAACLLARVSSRHQAGVIEKILTGHMSDRSHWANMIKSGNSTPSKEIFFQALDAARAFLIGHPTVRASEHLVDTPVEQGGGKATVEFFATPRLARLVFPLPPPERMPAKIVSTSFDKSPSLEGELLGVKGQYLIFTDKVFNVRRHEGYVTSNASALPEP